MISDPDIRAKVRSINIDTITFPFGSAEISDGQLDKLEDLADAILETLDRNPHERILIAGHTDAVGSFEANLELSEERAAAVLEILVEEFDVPAENLESVGYGEQYLLVETYAAERRNRRVVLRAVGSLLAEAD
ncbi:MAG: OmpA family protein [Hyphomicrobiaceae bacterium]